MELTEKFVLKVLANNKVISSRNISTVQKKFIFNQLGIDENIPGKKLSVEKIIDAAARYLNVDKALLATKSRKRELNYCRAVIYYILIRHLDYSSVRAGRIFNRNHPTVLHAMKVAETKLIYQVSEISKSLGLTLEERNMPDENNLVTLQPLVRNYNPLRFISLGLKMFRSGTDN